MSMMPPVRPAYDPELARVLDASELPEVLTPDLIGPLRAAMASPPIHELLQGRLIDHHQHRVRGPVGLLDSSVLRPRHHNGQPSIIYYLHAGGMVLGDRFTFIDSALDWVEQLGVAVVSLDYRLAPEHAHPGPPTRTGTWSHESDATGWDALLGPGHATTEVSQYAAPARATDLHGLPPAYIDVGPLRSSATRTSVTPPGCGRPESRSSCTSVVDNLEETEHELRTRAATTHRYSAPTGQGSYITHPDGVVVEYVQWNPELVEAILGPHTAATATLTQQPPPDRSN